MNRILLFLGISLMPLAITPVWMASVTLSPISYIPEIPEHCKNKTYCEDVINYPKDIAENLISKLDFEEYHPDDEIYMGMGKDYGAPNETYLCKSRPQYSYPLIAKNATGDWYFVLNRNRYNRPVQRLIVEVCDSEALDKPCGNGIDMNFLPTYETRCQQKYFLRYLVGLNSNGGPVEIVTDTPSCCDCIVKIKDGY